MKLETEKETIFDMKKIYLLLIISAIYCGVASATDSTSVKQDTLQLPVSAPVLSWDNPNDTLPAMTADYLTMPLVFDEFQMADTIKKDKDVTDLEFDINDEWLKSSLENRKREKQMRFNAMVENPQDVQFNANDLPEPPKTYLIKTDPSKRMVTIEEKKIDNLKMAQVEDVKVKHWIHSAGASVQISQAYVSKNWYQGGENNMNALGNLFWNVKLNENVYKNLLFENSIEYKVGVNSASQDELRNYTINQDLFQINTKFGYKAIKNWYYSTNMRFKTQMFNSYTPNTYDLKASFLSPADLNLGVGMTYNTTSKNNAFTLGLSLSPLSVDMAICREIKKIDPTAFGIDAGKHFNAEFGSNIEAKFVWKICREVTWTSRLFTFTNYENVQGDWENTFDFTINKYLSTRLYAHLRYDNSTSKDPFWKYWQFNEVLSFGFNYTFKM